MKRAGLECPVFFPPPHQRQARYKSGHLRTQCEARTRAKLLFSAISQIYTRAYPEITPKHIARKLPTIPHTDRYGSQEMPTTSMRTKRRGNKCRTSAAEEGTQPEGVKAPGGPEGQVRGCLHARRRRRGAPLIRGHRESLYDRVCPTARWGSRGLRAGSCAIRATRRWQTT